MCMSEEEKRKYGAVSAHINEHYLTNHTILRMTIMMNSTVFIIAGIASIGCWGHMLVLTWDNRGHPITHSAGIWGGVLALLPGIFGLLACTMKSHGMLGGQMWSCIGCIGGGYSQYVRLAYEAWSICTDGDSVKTCRPAETVATLALVCFILGIIMIVASAVVIIYFCYISCKGSKDVQNSINTTPGGTDVSVQKA